MKRTTRRIAGLVLAAVVAHADGVENFESNAVPASWSASAGCELTVSGERFRSGAQSLCWVWQKEGAALTCTWPAGFAGVKTSSTWPPHNLGFWVYNETPAAQALRLDLFNGEEAIGSCWYAMNFSGWRSLGVPYGQVITRSGRRTVTGFRLHAPRDTARGRLYLDHVNPVFAGVLLPDDQQPWVNPDAGKPMGAASRAMLSAEDPTPYLRDSEDMARNRPWVPKRVPAEQIAEQERRDLDTVAKRLPVPGVPLARVDDPAALQACREALHIRRQDGVLTGVPLAARFNNPPDGINAVAVFNRAAAAYLGAKAGGRAEEAAGLLQLLKDLSDHFQDQGLMWGSYSGPVGPAAETLLGLAGDLPWERCLRPLYLAALWNQLKAEVLVAGDLTAPAHGERGQWNNTDHFFYIFYRLPPYLAAIPDLADRLQFLRGWQAFIDRLCDDAMGEPFAPDGTIHHHQQQHVSYGTQMLYRLFPIVEALRDTAFRPSPATLATLKNVVTTAACESDRKDFCIPPSLPGYPGCPHAFAQGTYTLKDWVLILARCGSPDGRQPVDPEMAALYLELAGASADPAAKEFREAGYRPVIPGHRTLNGAGAALHRRDDWLVCAMGSAAGRRGPECNYAYAGSAYSRYMRNGSVFVVSSGTPVSFWDSGFQFEGYDWRVVPGATSLVTPPQATMGFTTGGACGGTSLDGDGIWGGSFAGEFAFHKSGFCFGNRVTLITTGIRYQEGKTNSLPFVTTLFQNSFARRAFTNAPADDPCWIDGEALKDFPVERTFGSEKGHWLVDSRGTGYYVEPGAGTLHLARRPQEWTYCFQSKYLKPGKPRDGNPENYTTTTGAYALAWLDHGVKPEAEACVYTLIPRTTPEAMKEFSGQWSVNSEQSGRPPYRILQKDDKAHILCDRDSRTTGYVIFDPAWDGTSINHSPSPISHQPSSINHSSLALLSASRPCFVMVREETNGTLRLSVACNEVKEWGWGTRPVCEGEMVLRIAGGWRVTAVNADTAVDCQAEVADGVTTLRLPHKQFMPVNIALEKKR